MERDAFKSRIPARLRGAVANRFLQAMCGTSYIHNGDRQAVVQRVLAVAIETGNRYHGLLDLALQQAIPAYFNEALLYAEYLAEMAQLPKEVRRAKKQQRESMRGADETAAQRRLLDRLGVSAAAGNRLDAHDMISSAKKASAIREAARAAAISAAFGADDPDE